MCVQNTIAIGSLKCDPPNWILFVLLGFCKLLRWAPKGRGNRRREKGMSSSRRRIKYTNCHESISNVTGFVVFHQTVFLSIGLWRSVQEALKCTPEEGRVFGSKSCNMCWKKTISNCWSESLKGLWNNLKRFLVSDLQHQFAPLIESQLCLLLSQSVVQVLSSLSFLLFCLDLLSFVRPCAFFFYVSRHFFLPNLRRARGKKTKCPKKKNTGSVSQATWPTNDIPNFCVERSHSFVYVLPNNDRINSFQSPRKFHFSWYLTSLRGQRRCSNLQPKRSSKTSTISRVYVRWFQQKGSWILVSVTRQCNSLASA